MTTPTRILRDDYLLQLTAALTALGLTVKSSGWSALSVNDEFTVYVSTKKRRDANFDTYEHDHDADERVRAKVFVIEKDAVAFARNVVNSRETVYGYATVTKQRYEQIEGTTLWDWEDVDEPVYIE